MFRFLELETVELWLEGEMEDTWRELGSPVLYLGSELLAGEEDQFFIRAGYGQMQAGQAAGTAVGLGMRYSRFELAMAFNNLMASPTFQSWLQGDPLDIDRLLPDEAEHPRILGLTASPGGTGAKIKEICGNLGIDAVEIRTEEDDDVVPVGNTLVFRDALRARGIEVETHLFAEGGHGFGLRGIEGKPADIWPELFERWLRSRMVVSAAP